MPVIIDDTLSYMPWGGDNNMPFDIFIDNGITDFEEEAENDTDEKEG